MLESKVKKPEKTTRNTTKKCANAERVSRKDELLSTSAKDDSNPQTRRRKNATSDPHDEMTPQKI